MYLIRISQVFAVIVALQVPAANASAQIMPTPEVASTLPVTHKKLRAKIELDVGIFYFPIYDLGGAGSYKVDGRRLMGSNLQYYCAIPGQQIWTRRTTDIIDQATFYFLKVTLVGHDGTFNQKQRLKFLFGLTHDKAQTTNTDATQPFFKMNDGGGEITLLADYGWQIGKNIAKITHDKKEHLAIDVNLQAGPFAAINEDSASVFDNGHHLLNLHRATVNPGDRRYEGYGLMGNVHTAFGYERRTWGVTVGLNLGGEWEHHTVAVREDNASNHRLTVNTYSIFLTPAFNVRVKIH